MFVNRMKSLINFVSHGFFQGIDHKYVIIKILTSNQFKLDMNIKSISNAYLDG